jgi:hypothetical protein
MKESHLLFNFFEECPLEFSGMIFLILPKYFYNDWITDSDDVQAQELVVPHHQQQHYLNRTCLLLFSKLEV